MIATASEASTGAADSLTDAGRALGPPRPVQLRRGEPGYPLRLTALPTPPAVLHVIGDAECLRGPVVAIVGTRDSTAYGERVTREIASALARAGACIVSGLARGIDAAAHRATLDVGGKTAAVLGTGVDVVYPVGHRDLHAVIGERGVLLSEMPLGTTPFRGCFPRRNRLIAGLADLTIVVEAGVTSGAKITADCAAELGRDVAAVPGPIDSPQSAGTNQLIRDGAHVITTIADALSLAKLTPRPQVPAVTFGESERAVLRALAAGPLVPDALTARSGLPVRECMAATTLLELAGAIVCELTGEIRLR